MDTCEKELCFVCDSEVMNKGVCLGVEKTFFTKTDFPTKISQLIGDDFMVVVTEDDSLCNRCATLINRADKFEMNLMEIKKVITGFLNVKYNLNTEEANTFSGLEHSKLENGYEDLNSEEMRLPYSDPTEVFEGDSTTFIDELGNSNTYVKSTISDNVFIKTDPSVCKYSKQCLDNPNDSRDNKNPNAQFLSEVLLRKLPENDLVSLDTSLSLSPDTLSPYKDSKKPQIVAEFFNNVKMETSSLEPIFKIEAASFSSGTEEKSPVFSQIDLSNQTSEAEHFSSLYEEPSSTNLQIYNIFEEKPVPLPLITNKAVKVKSQPSNKPVLKTRGVKSSYKKDTPCAPVKRLRPILPKIPNLNDILAPLCVIESSESNIVDMCASGILQMFDSKNGELAKLKSSKKIIFQREDVKSDNTNSNTFTDDSMSNKVGSQKTDSNLFYNVCPRNYENLGKLKRRKKEQVQNSKTYKCPTCEKVFKRKSSLVSHEVVHTGKFAFYCDFCGHGYASQAGLEEHRSCHTKEERFVCDVCGKKFNFQSTYWLHRKWHDNPYPYKCNDCGRLFKHSSMLSIHKRKHTGERPYKCPHCPLTFAVSNSFKRHMILHTKEYPFNCHLCKHGFTTRFRYNEHLERTHKVIVDKPLKKKEDYKMAVHDDEISGSERNDLQTKDTQNIIQTFPELRKSTVEIVFEPSLGLSDHSLTLSDSWFT